MMSTCAGDDSLEVGDEELSKRIPRVNGVWRERVQPQKQYGLQGQRKMGDFSGVHATCYLNCLGVDPKPLVRGCFAIVLGEADWFEAVGADVEVELSSERGKSVPVA